MKHFIVINNKKAITLSREKKDQAIAFAENFMDNSHEIIIREITSLKMFHNEDDGIYVEDSTDKSEPATWQG